MNDLKETDFGFIASDWNFIPSLEFCSKITDGTHDSPKQQTEGKHLVTSKHIKGRNIDFDNAYLIAQKDFDNINLRSRVDQWDVIISMIGEYCGFSYVERNNNIDYAVKNVGLLKTGSEHKALWLYYYLNSKIGRFILEINKSGTSQPYLTLGFLRDLPILYPPQFNEADKIIQILSSLDDKIDLLHRQNKTLEQLAETLFRQWFVEEAEESWETKTISEIIEVRDGTHDSPKQTETGRYLITSKHLKLTGIDFSTAYKISESDFADVNKRSKVDKDDILFSMIGTLGLIHYVDKEPDFAIKNMGLFKSSQKPSFARFLYLLLISPEGKRFVYENADGSTQEYITLSSLRNFEFKYPGDIKIEEFDIEIKPIFQKIESNQTQIRTLTQTRDTLQPKLMSGEVRVKI